MNKSHQGVSTTTSRDALSSALATSREVNDLARLRGVGHYTLTGPDGQIKQQGEVLISEGEFKNLVTDVGDEYYAKRGSSTTVNVPTGMRLGTGTTAVAKNGAGAAIVTYVTASQRAFDATYPSAATKGAAAGWRITYQSSWAAGVATANGIAEAVITNETALTDVAGTAANTISRALLSPVVNKGANDTLTITWYHDFLGA